MTDIERFLCTLEHKDGKRIFIKRMLEDSKNYYIAYTDFIGNVVVGNPCCYNKTTGENQEEFKIQGIFLPIPDHYLSLSERVFRDLTIKNNLGKYPNATASLINMVVSVFFKDAKERDYVCESYEDIFLACEYMLKKCAKEANKKGITNSCFTDFLVNDSVDILFGSYFLEKPIRTRISIAKAIEL